MRSYYKYFIFTTLALCFACIQAFSFELVLPKEKKSVVNSNYALFVGKTRNAESITINDVRIFPASNGAFAHSVKLHDGENRVIIRSNYSTKVYNFCKKTSVSKTPEEICDFETRTVKVKKDNTPLRNTPVDAGLNRISHLFKDTPLLINGSKGSFYRVFLAKDKIAWVSKNDVEEICSEKPAEFINMNSERFKNATVQTISFTKNLPYTVDDRDKEIVFKIYNPELSDNSVYTLNIPKPEKYYYSVNLENGFYTFKVSEVPQNLEDTTIVIDAGHGGSEKGAIGCLGDKEKDVNLKIALELQKILKESGANVIMTRECDGNISLNDRVQIAKENQADIFVSIHLNSIGDVKMDTHKHKGTSVYYFNRNSKQLAEILEKTVTKEANTRKDGVKTASFAVIRPTEYVAVLVETAYMINPHDSVLYISSDFAHRAATGIAEGIKEFISK